MVKYLVVEWGCKKIFILDKNIKSVIKPKSEKKNYRYVYEKIISRTGPKSDSAIVSPQFEAWKDRGGVRKPPHHSRRTAWQKKRTKNLVI